MQRLGLATIFTLTLGACTGLPGTESSSSISDQGMLSSDVPISSSSALTTSSSSLAVSSAPISSIPASSIPASSIPASSIPASSTPASSIPASSTPGSSSAASISSAPQVSSAASSEPAEPDPLAGLVGNTLNGASIYEQDCKLCHGNEGQGPQPLNLETKTDAVLALSIIERMPIGSASDCGAQCAADTLAYMRATFIRTEPVADACAIDERAVGDAIFRRLNGNEYNNNLRDLLAIGGGYAGTVRPIDRAGFISVGGGMTDASELSSFVINAQKVAAEGVNSAPDLQGVNVENRSEVRGFIRNFGLKAFRRPLKTTEIDEYLTVYDAGKNASSSSNGKRGVQWVIAAMLASPKFLYHIEQGEPNADATGLRPLTQYERASQLSHFLTGRYPDDALFQAAAEGKLTTRDQIRQQARRLLNTSQGPERIATFFTEWLDVSSIDSVQIERLNNFDPQTGRLANDLHNSVRRTIKHWLSQGATVSDMFLNTDVMVNRAIAQSWGLNTVPADNNTWMPVNVGESRRGILTHPAVMSVHGSDGFASATLRGTMIYERVLCRPHLELPDDLSSAFPNITAPLATSRLTLDKLHAESPACATCHNIIDPLGYGFEQFGSDGRFRQSEQLGNHPVTPVDASGTMIIDETPYSYTDAHSMMPGLAASSEVQACFNRHVMRYALQRKESEKDACGLQQIDTIAADTQMPIEEVFIEAAVTDSFLYIDGVKF